MQWTCDKTPYSTVMVCACGCRVAANTRDVALRLAAEHDRRAHPNTAQHLTDRVRRLR